MFLTSFHSKNRVEITVHKSFNESIGKMFIGSAPADGV
jgi:hypothetical protein